MSRQLVQSHREKAALRLDGPPTATGCEELPALGLVPELGSRSTRPGLRPCSAGSGTHLSVDGLVKRYDGRSVLHGLSLQIEAGVFVAIVGRSGCGKSTLLRIIAGLDRPSSGTVTLTTPIGERRPRVRLMFQEARLLPWKSVLANVALGLPKSVPGEALAVLHEVGLADRAASWPAELSGGQRQRVALARALLHKPDLLLLDEPLGALDALTRIEMQALIEQLWKEHGFTALLVTHDVQEAIALADRVLFIEDGGIAFDQRVDLSRPRARGSADFARLENDALGRVLRSDPNRDALV